MAVGIPAWLKVSAGLGTCAFGAWLLDGPARDADQAESRDAPALPAAVVRPAAAVDHPACPRLMSYVPGGQLSRPHPAQRIAPFCLARQEVTVDQYRACVAEGTCTPASDKRRCNWTREDVGDHPINCVTWAQADTFCSADGGRLPTEWEWEWAAQGGAKARTFPWGELTPGPFHANLCFNECRSQMAELEVDGATRITDGWVLTAPVGTYEKGTGQWGLQDMIGNVGEWTSTAVSRQDGHFVFRGASWYHHRLGDLNVQRFHAPGEVPDSAVGFRCAAFPGESAALATRSEP